MALSRLRPGDDPDQFYSWDDNVKKLDRLDDLGKYLSEAGDGSYWKKLARRLGFSHGEIRELATPNSAELNPEGAGYELLMRWGRLETSTLRVLRNHITAMNHADLIDKLHNVMANERDLTVVFYSDRTIICEKFITARGKVAIGQVLAETMRIEGLRKEEFQLRDRNDLSWWNIQSHKLKGQISLHRQGHLRYTEPTPATTLVDSVDADRPVTWPNANQSHSSEDVCERKRFDDADEEEAVVRPPGGRKASINRLGVTSDLFKTAPPVEHDESSTMTSGSSNEDSINTPMGTMCMDTTVLPNGPHLTEPHLAGEGLVRENANPTYAAVNEDSATEGGSDSTTWDSDINSDTTARDSDIISDTTARDSDIISDTSARDSDTNSDTTGRDSVISSDTAARDSGISSDTAARDSGISSDTAARDSGISSDTAARDSDISSYVATHDTVVNNGTAALESASISDAAVPNSDIKATD